jgi:hypothetical protein
VEVTEIFPGPGESWPTAEPLAGSGPITPTSTMRLDAPTCFLAGLNVHWYQYTLTNDLLQLGANAAGAIGIYDQGGQQLHCTVDAQAAPLTVIGEPGTTVYIGVQSAGPVNSLTLSDLPYTGVKGYATDLQVTFPSSPLTDYGMSNSAGEIYLGGTTQIFSFPKMIGALAAEHEANDGITTAHLGYDLIYAGGSVFSVDSITTTTVSRLFQVFDGTAWGPKDWDLTPAYPATSPSHALGFDGSSLLMSTRRTTASANFYSFSTAAPGAPVLLGTNTSVWYVTGMAADAQYLYVAGNGTAGEGVYRIERAAIANPAVKLASLQIDTLCTNLEIDDTTTAGHLYVRADDGDVHAIIGPAGSSFNHIGAISTLGGSSDYGMTYDQANGVLYLFETETDSAGRVVMLE